MKATGSCQGDYRNLRAYIDRIVYAAEILSAVVLEGQTMPRAQAAFVRPELQPQAVIVSAPPPPEESLPCAHIDSYSGDPNFMMSLARGLLVIQAFTQKKRQLTISQLSAKTGLSRAAVRRCLYTLAQ